MTEPERPILFGGVVMNNSPYLEPPTIPEGQTCGEYRTLRGGRKRSRWQRFVRRLNGHG